MTKPAATQNDTAMVGAQFIAPEASPEHGQKGGVSGWRDCKLGEFIFFQRGHDLPKTEMKAGSFPVAGSNGIIGYHDQFTTKSNGITIGRSGNIGTPHYYDIDFWAHNTVLYVKDFFGNNPKFSYYFLKTLDLQAFNSGSAVPTLNRNHIHELQIVVPPLDEQKAIAAVLSSLDDKIDLLHRQNQTLEAMAQTLFRQWFIEGAREDWTEGSLLNLVELVGGGTPKTSEPTYWDGDIPWLSGGDIAANHKGFVNTTQKSITSVGLNNSSTKLLPRFSTVISARGTVGKYCLLSEEMTFSQSNYGILPKVENCYFFTNLLIGYVVDELQSAAYGSVFDTITTSTFKEAVFLIPPFEKILQFEDMISSQFIKQLSNQKQIQTLTQLRDTLLPKLMSGEVWVLLGGEHD